MSISAYQSSSITRLAKEATPRLGWLLLAAVVCAVLGGVATAGLLQKAFLAAAAALTVFSITLVVVKLLCDRTAKSELNTLLGLVDKEATATIITDAEGAVLALNQSALGRFDASDTNKNSVSSILENSLANPSAIVFRLQTRVTECGAAQEDLVTRNGHLRINVHKASRNCLIWRVEDVPALAARYEGPVLPMILVSRANTVLYMNDPARKLVGGKLTALDRLFTSPVVSGSDCDIVTPDGPRRFMVSEMDAGSGRRALFLLPPGPEGDAGNSWNTFNNLPVPLLKVNSEGNVQAFNTMAANLIGPSLMNEAHLSEIMEGLGRPITDWLKETLARRASQQSEFLRLKRADREIFVQVTLNHIVENGSPFLIAVLNDATELKSLEAQFV
ncbi:MAG: PAS domain S-box protein, partial [Roseobacter sp.]